MRADFAHGSMQDPSRIDPLAPLAIHRALGSTRIQLRSNPPSRLTASSLHPHAVRAPCTRSNWTHCSIQTHLRSRPPCTRHSSTGTPAAVGAQLVCKHMLVPCPRDCTQHEPRSIPTTFWSQTHQPQAQGTASAPWSLPRGYWCTRQPQPSESSGRCCPCTLICTHRM